MLSLVLYGRNDNYGYNLHKRAALSLNCMAEVLSRPEDEILFVDYNTPDDYPTFPEAIQDTLTPKARRHLRILRARPGLHARFAKKTHLLALEPVARNIALRRSNPANRWVLSTNTDMVFVPRTGRSLSEVVAELPTGHYGVPRFEIPETLWEGLDRTDAQGVIESFGRWGWDLHLNEIVYGMPPFRFDGPGDFQLMLREDLFRWHGFHEEMLLGWHVDANIAKRFGLVYGDVGDLSAEVFGYHCDHTRQVTPAHRRDAVQNSVERFFTNVDRPDVPEQAESWGCPDAEVEEIRLAERGGAGYLASLSKVLTTPLAAPLTSSYALETWDKTGYSPQHVLPFLLDLFASAPRGQRIAWFGAHGAMLELFQGAWAAAGGSAPILLPEDAPGLIGGAGIPGTRAMPLGTLLEDADALVFDFADSAGAPVSMMDASQGGLERVMAGLFFETVLQEQGAIEAGRGPRRFVGINAIHNSFERLFNSHVNIARTPFSVRLRHGFYANGAGVEDWLRLMVPGPAGQHDGKAILGRAGQAGCVAYGPYLHPLPGRYALTVEIQPDQPAMGSGADGASGKAPNDGVWRVAMAARQAVGDSAVRQAKLGVRRLLGDEKAAALKRQIVAAINPAARAHGGVALVPEITLEIATGDEVITSLRLNGAEAVESSVRLEFDVPKELFLTPSQNGIELRVYGNGLLGFRVARVEARQISSTARAAQAAARNQP